MSLAPAPQFAPELAGEMADGARAADLPAVIRLPDQRHRMKKVTSGSANRQRTVGVLVRLHPVDADRLRAEAAAAGVSLPAYLASGRIGTEAAPRPRLRRRYPAADVVALTAALVAINRAGNNQNQIARSLNELLLIAQEQSSTRLESSVADLADAIKELPTIFAAPVAAILAALGNDRQG